MAQRKIETAAEVIEKYEKRLNSPTIDTVSKAMLYQLLSNRLDTACYCEENVCCAAHGKHSTPHMNCLMR